METNDSGATSSNEFSELMKQRAVIKERLATAQLETARSQAELATIERQLFEKDAVAITEVLCW